MNSVEKGLIPLQIIFDESEINIINKRKFNYAHELKEEFKIKYKIKY